MSTSSSTESRGSETVEQLIGECFVKTAQAILSSRVYEPPAAGSKERNDKRSAWFKLNLQELESARQPLDRWRVERGVGLPLVLEIYLQPYSATYITSSSSEETLGTLIERWYLHYRPSVTGLPLPLSHGGLSRSQMTRLSPQHVYKRLMLLVRSVYSYCRVLPAYKLYRTERASYTSPPFHLKYKLHSTLPQSGDAASARMQRFEFSPVETADAKLHLVVEYQPASTIRVLGQAAVRIPRPAIIQNYVKGSDSLEKKNTNLLERGKSQGITMAAVASGGGETSLTSAPSAPAALSPSSAGAGGGGSTPRRGWSSSFRLSPARIYEPPVYTHQKYPSPTPSSPSYATPAVRTSLPENSTFGQQGIITTPSHADTRLPILDPQQQTQQQQELQQQRLKNRVPSPFESSSAQNISGRNNNDGGGVDSPKDENNTKEGSHVSSSPMAIPGTSAAHYKKRPQGLRSSGDLGALERGRKVGGGGGGGVRYDLGRNNLADVITDGATVHEYTSDKPMSAPALSYMHQLSAAGKDGEEEDKKKEKGESSVELDKEDSSFSLNKEPKNTEIYTTSPIAFKTVTGQQNLPLPSLTVNIHQMPTYMDTTTASTSSYPSYPVPPSPDLPFAFTPSARYSCSPASVASSTGGGGGGGGRGLLRSLSRPSPTSFYGSSGSDTHHVFGAPTPPGQPPATQMIVPSNSPSPSSLSGREIPAGTALMRRASWGTRSIRGEGGPIPNTTATATAVGYSISPMRDTMLDSVVLSASTPRNLFYTTSAHRPGGDIYLASSRSTIATAAGGGSGGGSGETSASNNKRDPLLLTFPASPSQGEVLNNRITTAALLSGHAVERTRGATAEGRTGTVVGMRLPREDSEQLAFDFTADTSEASNDSNDSSSGSGGGGAARSGGGGVGGGEQRVPIQWHINTQSRGDSSEENQKATASGKAVEHPPAPAPAAAAFDIQSSAASIGAFMRLINEAQPLSGLAPIPIEVGMHQLDALRTKLSSCREKHAGVGGTQS